MVQGRGRWRSLENAVMHILTVHSKRLPSGEQSYLREYILCVLRGTGHQLLFIN